MTLTAPVTTTSGTTNEARVYAPKHYTYAPYTAAPEDIQFEVSAREPNEVPRSALLARLTQLAQGAAVDLARVEAGYMLLARDPEYTAQRREARVAGAERVARSAQD